MGKVNNNNLKLNTMEAWSYVIIKHNSPELERESVLLENKYKPKSKYAFINKIVHKDGSESISYIHYSNDLELLQNRAKDFVSWYNYPIGLSKSIQGYISELP
jgi:hypothetical protein